MGLQNRNKMLILYCETFSSRNTLLTSVKVALIEMLQTTVTIQSFLPSTETLCIQWKSEMYDIS